VILATIGVIAFFLTLMAALGRAIVWVDERAYRAAMRSARRRRALVRLNTKL